MQITLKKVLLVGILLLAAVFFFLVVCLPVSRTVTVAGFSTTATGSLMGVLAGDKASLDMVAGQINIKDYASSIDSISGAVSAAEAYQKAVEALQTVYKVFAVFGIILFVVTVLALIGAFFMKLKGARVLSIIILALDIVLFLVIMIFSVLMTVSTDMAVKGAEVSVSTPTVLMYVLGIVFFIGALIASGVVKEKVLVGKKN